MIFMGIKSIFSKNSKNTDREIWVNTLSKIIDPVLTNVANETLKEKMPVAYVKSERAKLLKD